MSSGSTGYMKLFMKNTLPSLLILFLCISFSSNLFANHIVGGELQMKSMGSNRFSISLIQFWDRNNLTIPTATMGGNRDTDALLYIYSKKNNMLMDQLTVFYQSVASIEYQNKACATSRSLETATGIYTGTITLNPQKYTDPEGYYVVWERCCRNRDINNIVDPGANGMVFYLEFPPTNITNSSPEFKTPNGQYICSKREFAMNMSATDADGDELRYSLVVPMRGNTGQGQTFGSSFSNGIYPLVKWTAGISLANVIPGPQPLSINASGTLKVVANTIGLYVFAIQCEEYRNGKRIGLVRRDFQLLVIDCSDDTPKQPVVMFKALPATEVKFCPEKPAELETESAVDWSYQWQLNGLNIPGATTAKIMVKDTGNYSVVKSFSKKCSRDTSSSVVHVTYSDPVEAKISVDKNIICEGETAVLLANGGLLAANTTCSWSVDKILIASIEPKITATKAGTYSLVITDQNYGCTGTASDTIVVEKVEIALAEKISIIEGSSITLSPKVKPEGLSYTYEWSPNQELVGSNTLTATVSPLDPTDYLFTAVSENGCSDTALIHINVIDKMHIPTAFSPNNDGHNDTFEIFNAKGQIETIMIYNRWGQVIFSSEGYDKPWNGTYKNESVPAGTYPYRIKTAMADYKGEILLLR